MTAELHNVLASDAGDPAFSPEEPSQEALSLLTATIDEDIERIFLRPPRRRAARADRGTRPGRARAARDPRPDRRGRARDPHPRRLPPRPDPVHAARLGDHRLRGRAGAAAARAPPEALAAARCREHAALVRLRDLGGRDPARTGAPRRTSSSARGSASWAATSTTSIRALLPAGEAEVANLLSIFELEKAIYELRTSSTTGPIGSRSRSRVSARLLEEQHDDRRHRRARRARPPRALEPARGPRAHPADRRRRDPRAPPGRARDHGAPRWRRRASSSSRSTRAACSRAVSRAPSCRCATSSRSTTATAGTFTIDDPYSFPPTLGELDLHLIGEGRHEELYEKLGAHVREHEGVHRRRRLPSGRRRRARSASSATSTRGTGGCTRCARSAQAGSGSCSCPASSPGARYKFEILTADGELSSRPTHTRCRPRSRRRPHRSSSSSHHEWSAGGRHGSSGARERSRSPDRSRSTRSTSAPGG